MGINRLHYDYNRSQFRTAKAEESPHKQEEKSSTELFFCAGIPLIDIPILKRYHNSYTMYTLTLSSC